MKITMRSSAIRCGGCANNVKSILSQAAGVRSVNVDPATKVVDVEFDEAATSAEAIASRLADAGYPADAPANSGG